MSADCYTVHMSTLLSVRQQQPKKPDQTELEYEDMTLLKTFGQLYEKFQQKALTKDEEKEYEDVRGQVFARHMLAGGAMSESHADSDRKHLIGRVHRELRAEYGDESVTKKILIDRLASAYSMALSYERYFASMKYSLDANGRAKTNLFPPSIMKEMRMGIESSNDQIIRFVQALRDINRPPITVKTKNAFFAQNQRVNQGVPPRDLENDSFAKTEHATHS